MYEIREEKKHYIILTKFIGGDVFIPLDNINHIEDWGDRRAVHFIKGGMVLVIDPFIEIIERIKGIKWFSYLFID